MKKATMLLAIALIGITLSSCIAQPSLKEKKKVDELQPSYGGTLKIYSYNSDTFNPLYTRNKANAQMLMLVFDNLIKCDENQHPVPVLASDFNVSANGLIWTIHLKSGVSWHDGSAFTADDVVATLNAIKNSSYNSIYKSSLQNVGKIENIENAVVITLNSPQTNFINLLEIPIVKASDSNTFNNFGLIGTGQFMYAEKTNKIIYLSSNKSWWGESTPYIESIEVYLLPDKSTSVYAYEAKEIDMVTTDMQNWGKFSGNSESKAVEYNSGSYNFLKLNLNNKFLENNQVRVAFAHAINKQRIFEEVMLSHGTLTDTCMSPKWWVYNENTTKYNYDPKLAITLLAELQLKPSDLKINILVNNDNEIKLRVADIIKGELKDIGIDANITAVNWDSFVSAVSKGSYDVYLGEVNYSTEINPQYALPYNNQFEPLIQQLQLQTTDEGRKALYDEIQQEYANVLPSIPLYFDAEALLYHGKIHGKLSPLRNNMFDNANEWFIIESN